MLTAVKPGARRSTSILVAVALAGLVLFLAVRFGPVPNPPLLSAGAAPDAGKPIVVSRPHVAAAPPVEPEMLLSLFGASRVVDSEGCDAIALDRYAANVEADYNRAGYMPVQDLPVKQAKTRSDLSQIRKTYWRADAAGSFSVGAFSKGQPGTGHTKSILETISAAADPGCGTRWKKYHYEMPAQNGKKGHVSGVGGVLDSGDLPLPSGTENLFSVPARSGAYMRFYSIAMTSDSARRWFRAAMSRNWRDVNPPGRRAGAPGSDLLYFTQVDRYCMIFVSKGKGDSKSIAIVSIGRL